MTTAVAEDTEFTHPDVDRMDLEDLLETGPEDTKAVQAIDERIAELEDRLDEGEPDREPVESAEQHLQAAEENLSDVRRAYELGNADESDVETAESAVKAAKEELEQAKEQATEDSLPGFRREAIREALSELQSEREAAVASARRALADRARALRDKLAKQAHEAFAEAIEATHKMKRLHTHANHTIGDGRRSVLKETRAIPQGLEPYTRETMDVLNQGKDLFGADVERTLEKVQE